MDYREKAVRCVRETVLPIQMAQFQACGCDLDAQYRKYGDTESFFAKVLQPRHRYEVGYPKCVCPEVLDGTVTDAAHCECSRQSVLYILEQLLPGLFVVQRGLTQAHEQAVLVGIGDLLCAKGQIEQIPVRRAGQGPAEDRQIFFLVLLRHQAEWLTERGQNFTAGGDIAAVDGGQIGAVRLHTAPQLADLFVGHGKRLLVLKVLIVYHRCRDFSSRNLFPPGTSNNTERGEHDDLLSERRISVV